MPASFSRITTSDGSRLIKRLCTHWAHKLEVSFDDTQARIAFDPDTIAHLSAQPTLLLARINAPDEARLAQIQDVMTDHLQRMARKETLESAWQPEPDNS